MVAFCLFAYFPYGGLQRDFLKVALECVQRGYRVRVYAMSWQGGVPDGIEWVPVPQSGLTNHRITARFAQWVAGDLDRRPADCVVGFNRIPGLDIYYAADSCFEEKARSLRSLWYRYTARYRLFARFERAVLDPGGDTRILVLTEQQQKQFQAHYATPDERFDLMPPGIGTDRRRPGDADTVRKEFRAEFELHPQDRLLLLIGSGFVTKGVDRAIRALAALPNERGVRTLLFVIGEDSARPFEKLAGDLGIGERVRFFQGRDDVPRFLQGADLMIHPAYLESGGIVLLEAIIAGLPVLATQTCGFAPRILHADAGCLVPDPFEQKRLDALLQDALEDSARLARWSANGIRYGQSADLYAMGPKAVDVIEARLKEQRSV
ncbi:MAG: glycosyltransferase family 4 protein [Pseudomonadales bacterium]|nr:glycosyltransferase family 4 protein [Pseudomonadales bacterium]MDP6469527.1 glycosyltransferase family 4 protein [Pseudomonadales bacterium]MDP6827368.1 glycosyltransferase family 4 protein [Pseudomonadales bacterium]MDP6971191.1 glycosyltransferase family 4 protein [Pseudomonadales bacterium]